MQRQILVQTAYREIRIIHHHKRQQIAKQSEKVSYSLSQGQRLLNKQHVDRKQAPNSSQKLKTRRSVGPAAEPPWGGSNCTASRRLHCLPSDFALVGGSRRA